MVVAEKFKFRHTDEIHHLPEIYHYWSNKYLAPQIGSLGYIGIDDFFLKNIKKQAKENSSIRILSIGAGDCQQDVGIVSLLIESGVSNFVYECLDINEVLLQRGRDLANSKDVSEYMLFVKNDILNWQPQELFNVVIANQFLHHVVDLEDLYSKISDSLFDTGIFLVSDLVGRNGHMRWPEALELIEELWEDLPEKYKYHHLHRKTYKKFVNWDCSITGFEGIRAQDILPLLIRNFEFETFIAFGNVIDVFVDRTFGPNFNIDNENDLKFIDHVQKMDQGGIESGSLKPTHILAVMRLTTPEKCLYYKHLSPEFCVRSTGNS